MTTLEICRTIQIQLALVCLNLAQLGPSLFLIIYQHYRAGGNCSQMQSWAFITCPYCSKQLQYIIMFFVFFIKSILTCVTDSPRYQNSCHGVSKLLAGSEKGLTLCTKPSMTGQVPPDVFAPPVRNKVNDIYQILMLNNETIIPQISNTLLQESKLRRKVII